MNRPKLDIIIVVWSAEFTAAFLNVTLPSVLASGNLPMLAERATIRLKICTSTDDADSLKTHPTMLRAKAYADVLFYQVAATELSKRHRYLTHTSMLEAAIATSREEKADFMILAPDFVVGNGSLFNLYNMLGERRGIVFVPTIRTNKYAFLSELLDIYGDEVTHAQSLTIPNRDLAGLALRHLHPLVQSAIVTHGDNGKIYCRPPIFYWTVGDDALLMRSFVWSPLFVRPNRWPEKLSPTIDFQDFPNACAITREEIVPVSDSDELMILEFSSYTADFYQVAKPHATIEGVLDWIGRIGMPHHLMNLEYSYLLHASELTAAAVNPIRADAELTAAKILKGTLPLIKFQLAPKLRENLQNA
jgi:hypothetical protein